MTSNIAPLTAVRIVPNLQGAARVLTLNCQALLGPTDAVPAPSITHASSHDLDAAMLARVAPDLVIVPLFAGDLDATMIIERLVALGYCGRVAVLAPTLPNPRLVEQELRGLGLRVALISP